MTRGMPAGYGGNDGTAFLVELAKIIVAAALLGAILRVGLGPRWFSFYGYAAIVLAMLVPLSRLVLGRFGKRRIWKWLAAVIIGATAAAAVVQIGYWMAFFNLVDTGTILGVGRSMIKEILDPFATIAMAALAGGWVLLGWAAWGRTR